MNAKKTNTYKCIPSVNHPDMLAFIVDFLALVRKYPTLRLAESLNVSKQAINNQIAKKK